ncbi:MAG: hypothetical protein ACYTDY_10220 [Planctomycetota bacterium]
MPVAEAAFRILGMSPSDDLAGLYEGFGDGSYRPRPSCAATAYWVTGRFGVYTDALGFRCGEGGRGAVRTGSDVDVLVLGDSQGFGNGVDYSNTIPGMMEEYATPVGVAIANASVGGHFLRNQFELVHHLGEEEGVRPRVVLVLLTPRMIFASADYAQAHVHTDGRLYGGPPGFRMRLRTWLKTHLAIYIAIRNAHRGLFGEETVRFGLIEHYRTAVLMNEKKPALRERFTELKTWCESRGGRLVVAFLPFVQELRFHEFEAAGAPMEGISEDAPFRVSDEVCRELGVEHIDMRPMLRKRLESGDPVQLDGDAHYNSASSRECGRVIWSALGMERERSDRIDRDRKGVPDGD